MELTVTRPDEVVVMNHSTSEMARIISVLRESSVRRAPAGMAVDEPGITGVLSGTAPILWAYEGVDAQRLASLAQSAPELDEVYVDRRCTAAADALLGSGEWVLRDVMDQQVFLPGENAVPTVSSEFAMDAAGPADMH